MNFASNLQKLRKRENMSQEALAEKGKSLPSLFLMRNQENGQ